MAYNTLEKKQQYDKRYALTTRGRASNLIRSARNRAKRKGFKFNLNVDWVERKIVEGVCQITGVEFDLKPSKGTQHNYFAPSIDKIDPKKGYVMSNCQVVLWGVNSAKGEMNMKEFKKFIKLIWEGMNNE